MNVIRSGLAALCSVVLVAARAPDAWKSNPAYDSFLDQVQITPQSWTSSMIAFLEGREGDPGVQAC